MTLSLHDHIKDDYLGLCIVTALTPDTATLREVDTGHEHEHPLAWAEKRKITLPTLKACK